MRKNTNTVNAASKDVLAKAMAMEGITVQHDANAETAWFNVESRTLCLPVWEDMSNDVYDMLVGHEVSHALHTPVDGWKSWIGKDQHSGVRHQFLNIVEDARIERLIKSKFPGLKRNFSRAYKQFNDKNMFELKGDNLADRELIDRLNIEFKLGLYGHTTVPFSADEQQFVDRMHKAETIEDVQELAQDLFERWLSKQPEDEQKSQPEMGEGGEGQDGGGNESPQGAQGDEQQSQQDGSADSSGDTDGSGDESSDDNSQKDGEGQQNSEDSGQSMTDDTDDGESADSSEGDNTGDGEQQGGLEYDDYSNAPCSAGSTQRAFDKAVQSMRNENAGEYKYYTLPKMNADNIIVGYKDIIALFNQFNADNSDRISSNTGHADCINDCNEFMRKSRPVVNHMVQRFMMKQSAEAMKKTEITKTGILDTTSMINYRWSEDIFLKNETHDDGKSHGIVMFLDWSGSMCDILKETIEQLIINVEFCKKMQIPFEVYAFTSNTNGATEQYTSCGGNNELKPHRFNLLNFLSSKMNNREYKQSIENLWLLGESNTWKRRYYIMSPSQFRLGCTPLNEAIVTAFEIVPAFQRENGVQIVNTVFLTDGDGHSMGAYRCGYSYKESKSFIVDPQTRQNIEVDNNGCAAETSAYLQILKNQTGCNIIGIRLSTQRKVDNLKYRYFNSEGGFDQQAIEDAAKSYKTNNFFSIKDCEGCDELFVIKGDIKVMTDAMEGLSDNASLAKVRNAFVKGNNKKKASRVIASRIIDLIAV